jgi:hypothetical protein
MVLRELMSNTGNNRDKSCELCKLVEGNIRTRKYYRDGNCIIVDCETCRVPMAVINHHGPASEREERLMTAVIHHVFPGASIRKEPRQIKNHVHWHVLVSK